MKLFQNLFNKNHELNEEEQHKFNSMVGDSSPNSVQKPLSLQESISQLKTLEELNKVRNLLDSREKEIDSGSQYLVDSEISHSVEPEFEEIPIKEKIILEENIENPISENELNHETYQEDPSTITPAMDDFPTQEYTDSLNKYEENTLANDSPGLSFGDEKEEVDKHLEYEDLDNEEQSQPMPEEMLIKEERKGDSIEIDLEDEEDDNQFVELEDLSDQPEENLNESIGSPEFDMYLEKVTSIFGKDNILSKIEDKNSTTYNPTKKLLHIGIREKESFGNGDPLEENAWFIGHVKQLEDLKSFKMLRSEQGMKDLVAEKENFVVILSFRATSFLNSINDFDFNL